METDILYALALIFEQVSATGFILVTEPVKMTIEKCVEIATQINMDTSHQYVMTCTPFIEKGVGV